MSNPIRVILTNGTIVECPVGQRFEVTCNGSRMEFFVPPLVEAPLATNIAPFLFRAFIESFYDKQGESHKIPCIKAVKVLSGLGLGEAKYLVEKNENFRVYSTLESFQEQVSRLKLLGINLTRVGFND